jgi:hypothetical protein
LKKNYAMKNILPILAVIAAAILTIYNNAPGTMDIPVNLPGCPECPDQIYCPEDWEAERAAINEQHKATVANLRAELDRMQQQYTAERRVRVAAQNDILPGPRSFPEDFTIDSLEGILSDTEISLGNEQALRKFAEADYEQCLMELSEVQSILDYTIQKSQEEDLKGREDFRRVPQTKQAKYAHYGGLTWARTNRSWFGPTYHLDLGPVMAGGGFMVNEGVFSGKAFEPMIQLDFSVRLKQFGYD